MYYLLDVSFEAIHSSLQKLMRHSKDEDTGVLRGLSHIALRYNVSRQLDTREVLLVLMLGIDDFRELATLKHLFEYVHPYFLLEEVRTRDIFRDDLRHGRAPVARAEHAGLEWPLS